MAIFGAGRRQPDSATDRERVRRWLIPWIEGRPPRGRAADREACVLRFFGGGLSEALERYAHFLADAELRRGRRLATRPERTGGYK